MASQIRVPYSNESLSFWVPTEHLAQDNLRDEGSPNLEIAESLLSIVSGIFRSSPPLDFDRWCANSGPLHDIMALVLKQRSRSFWSQSLTEKNQPAKVGGETPAPLKGSNTCTSCHKRQVPKETKGQKIEPLASCHPLGGNKGVTKIAYHQATRSPDGLNCDTTEPPNPNQSMSLSSTCQICCEAEAKSQLALVVNPANSEPEEQPKTSLQTNPTCSTPLPMTNQYMCQDDTNSQGAKQLNPASLEPVEPSTKTSNNAGQNTIGDEVLTCPCKLKLAVDHAESSSIATLDDPQPSVSSPTLGGRSSSIVRQSLSSLENSSFDFIVDPPNPTHSPTNLDTFTPVPQAATLSSADSADAMLPPLILIVRSIVDQTLSSSKNRSLDFIADQPNQICSPPRNLGTSTPVPQTDSLSSDDSADCLLRPRGGNLGGTSGTSDPSTQRESEMLFDIAYSLLLTEDQQDQIYQTLSSTRSNYSHDPDDLEPSMFYPRLDTWEDSSNTQAHQVTHSYNKQNPRKVRRKGVFMKPNLLDHRETPKRNAYSPPLDEDLDDLDLLVYRLGRKPESKLEDAGLVGLNFTSEKPPLNFLMQRWLDTAEELKPSLEF